MLIKRVVIQGFKTFARRAEFVFDPGVTAVVGPNGSGKSNIVDAVRWCLGEQSFGLLRSKKTSDIIFSGSDKKARLGMAQVSLTLDNSGGEIPIDFAEVEITRRAYRDGDNEYIVNGQRVRLQDVTELLSQTGLGKRTYAVIGQGLIDKVLSLAPEERRSLFEEAAGITGYQSKREASIRRLDATQVNLTRVRDIVAELAPRMSTLKRQAERARERELMVADLRGMLREWYGYRWHAAIAQVEEHHADAKILQNQVDDRQILLDAVAAEIEALHTRQSALRAIVGERHHAAGALHSEAEAVGRDLAVRRERRRQVLERLDDAQSELGLLQVEHESLSARLAQLQAELLEAESERTATAAALRTTESALSERRREQETLQQTIEAARRTLARTQQQATEAIARYTQIAERIQTIELQAQTLATSLQAAQAAEASARANLAQAEAAHALLEARATELQADMAALEARRTALRSELDEAEATRRQADREVDKLQTRNELLARLSQEGAGLASGVRAVLQADLPGMIGPVASLLRVDSVHEKAIETALGGALQNVVTLSWEDAQNAIEHLKLSRRGRATFLPLDRLNTSPAIAAPRMQGVLGNAADLVACDARATAARDHLLNRTWIVADLPAARRALDALRSGARPTVVTLDGEIVRPGGAVTGGSDGERRDDSVLARERERRELPTAIEAARIEAQALASRCRGLAGQQAEATGAAEAQQLLLTDLARNERSARSLLDETRRVSDRAAQQVRYLNEQAHTGEAESSALAARLTEAGGAVESTRGARADAEAALAMAEARAAQSAADELLRTLADDRAAEATAAGVVQSRRALAEQQQRTLEGIARRIQSKQQQTATLESEGEALELALSLLGAQEAEVRRRLDALQAELAPQEAQLAALEATESEAGARERRLQHAQRIDESATAHATLIQQRSEDGVAQLRAEIERDLGLAAMETSGDVAYQPPLPFDAFVEQLPVREHAPEGVEEELLALRGRLSRLINVNPDAPREYDEAAQRFEHLTVQADDLESAAADLHRIIAELDARMQIEFTRTFQLVAEQFQVEFRKLFNGGAAEIILTEPDNVATSGIEVIARPPGKRPQSLALLSGGERSLAACALIFAILRVSPTPFCVLDEVDAALDEANVDRFRLAVEDLSVSTQFIIVTHNRRTLEGANTIYGITMGDDGVSKVISLRLEGDAIVHHKNGESGVGAPALNDEDVALSSTASEQLLDGDLQQLSETIAM